MRHPTRRSSGRPHRPASSRGRSRPVAQLWREAREAPAIDLEAGLYLEDRGIRLIWHSSPEELRRLTMPDYCAVPAWSGHSLVLAWDDRVFGGLACQVTAALEVGEGSLCGVRLVFRYPEWVHSLPAGFGWLGRHLAEHLGPPVSIQEDGERGEARWAIRGIGLRHE